MAFLNGFALLDDRRRDGPAIDHRAAERISVACKCPCHLWRQLVFQSGPAATRLSQRRTWASPDRSSGRLFAQSQPSYQEPSAVWRFGGAPSPGLGQLCPASAGRQGVCGHRRNWNGSRPRKRSCRIDLCHAKDLADDPRSARSSVPETGCYAGDIEACTGL